MSKASAGWQDASARTKNPSSLRSVLGIETRSKGKPTSAGVACDSSPGLSVSFSKEPHGLPSPANATLDLIASTMRRVNTDRQCLILSSCEPDGDLGLMPAGPSCRRHYKCWTPELA